jgi:hypothetical protein
MEAPQHPDQSPSYNRQLIVTNVPNEQSQTAGRGWYSSLEFGWEAKQFVALKKNMSRNVTTPVNVTLNPRVIYSLGS